MWSTFHTNRRYVIFFACVVLTRIFCRRMIRQELRPIAKKREKEKERGGVNINKCVSVPQSKQANYKRYLIYPLLKICFSYFFLTSYLFLNNYTSQPNTFNIIIISVYVVFITIIIINHALISFHFHSSYLYVYIIAWRKSTAIYHCSCKILRYINREYTYVK